MAARHHALAAAALALCAGAWWWWPAAHVAAPAVAAVLPPPPALPSPFGSGPVVVGPDAQAPAPAPEPAAPVAAAPEHAPGLGLAELQELKAQLAAEGPARDEAGHMAEHLLFSDAVLRLKHLHQFGGDAAERQGVALIVAELLDTELKRGNLTPAQARELQSLVSATPLQRHP